MKNFMSIHPLKVLILSNLILSRVLSYLVTPNGKAYRFFERFQGKGLCSAPRMKISPAIQKFQH